MRIKYLLLIFIFTALLFAQDKRKIGLVPFSNASGDSKYEWLSYGFEYYLYGKLAVVSGFYVPEKEEFFKSLKKAGYPDRTIDEKMIFHLGKYSGIEVAVTGSYKVSGSRFQLEVHYSNAFNGSEILSSKYSEPLSNFFSVGRKVIDELINLAGITVSPTENKLLDFTFTRSIRAYESFIRAYMENEKPNSRLEVVTGLFRQAIREDAKFWEAYYNLGIVYFNARSYAQALEQFNRVIKALPNFDKPYYGRALIYQKQKKYDLAIEDLKKVTQFNPNDYKPFYNLGRISILQGKYKEAEEFLNKSISLNPDNGASYYQLGNLYYEQNAYRKSITYFKKAVALEKDNADYHLKLGDTYYRSQIFYNALVEIEASIKIDPTNSIAYFLKGITVYKQAVLEELVNAFLDILSESPTKETGKPNKSRRKTAIDPINKKQVYDDMAQAFSDAIRLKPDFMEATFNLALTYHEMGNTQLAEKFYMRTIQLRPNLIRAHLKLAELFTETNRKPQAIDQYRRIFQIEPGIFVNHPTLGEEHQYINVLNKFRDELEEKLQRDPNNPANNLLMAKLFKALGNYGKAGNLARKVLSITPSNREAKEILKAIQR